MKTFTIVIPSDIPFHDIQSYLDDLEAVDVTARVVIDMSSVTEVYSSLVRFLIDMRRLISLGGGEMAIVLSDPARRTFRTIGMDLYFAREIDRGAA